MLLCGDVNKRCHVLRIQLLHVLWLDLMSIEDQTSVL